MARGYGKLILFGEHFVVYGMKAIATGLKDLYIDIEIKEGEWNFSDKMRKKALIRIAEALGIKSSFSLTINSNLPVKSNLGSSAALSVAFARALNKFYNLGLNNEEINNLAYEGEKVFHGNPSGIDNTCATYGSPIIYQKGKPIIPLTPLKPLHILIINSGPKLKGTKDAVEYFARMKKELNNSDEIFNEYSMLIEHTIDYINNGDLQGIGKAINKNHELLRYFGVSTEKIESLREELFSNGALASKITGAGFGGNIYALFKNKEDALRVKDKFNALYTSI